MKKDYKLDLVLSMLLSLHSSICCDPVIMISSYMILLGV